MKTTVLLAVLFACLGCTCREVGYEGVTYKHRSFGTTQSFGKLSLTHPNGAEVRIENYANDQVSAIREAKEMVQELNRLKTP